ncbi:hypothetical protein PVAG01_01069 [Phlyctema vagabunda]|uniref:Uncharacterized protein n=1 Tax=Phlyctema vagabunda TaxID=108571 RepID=A0ABR4PW23_9HELO
MAPPAFPSNIFKIVPTEPPAPLPSKLESSQLDSTDGFIHTSTAGQIPITTGLYFSAANEIWVLKLSTKALTEEGGRVIWEGPEGCIHIYLDEKTAGGESQLPALGSGNVTSVKKYERKNDEDWKSVFARDTQWLKDEDN